MPTIPEDEREIARKYLPPVVYLPAGRVDGQQGPEVQFRELFSGGLALLAYTSLDRMARALGPHQPWVMVQTDQLATIMERQECDELHFDLPLPEDLWQQNLERR